jgi:hypothetical protein
LIRRTVNRGGGRVPCDNKRVVQRLFVTRGRLRRQRAFGLVMVFFSFFHLSPPFSFEFNTVRATFVGRTFYCVPVGNTRGAFSLWCLFFIIIIIIIIITSPMCFVSPTYAATVLLTLGAPNQLRKGENRTWKNTPDARAPRVRFVYVYVSKYCV